MNGFEQKLLTADFLKLIIDTAMEAIFVLDSSGKYVFINNSAGKITSEDKENWLGNMAGRYIHHEYKNIARQSFESALSGNNCSAEIMLVLPEEKICWLHINYSPLTISSQKYVLCMATDISARKSTELSTKESEAKYRLLAENVKDIIWTMDLDWNFTYISPSVFAVRGFTVKEAMAQKPSQTMTKESYERAVSMFREELDKEAKDIVDASRYHIIEVEQYHKNGNIIPCELTVSFLRDEKSIPIGIIGVARDITERKRLEEQIETSKKMELIATLAGGIAHDFNNLLTPILTYVGLLEESGLSDQQLEDLGEIGNSLNKTVELVRKFRSISEGHAGRLEVSDLGEIFSEVVCKFSNVNSAIVFDNLINLSEYYAQVDGQALSLAIKELLENAIDAINEKPDLSNPCIRISAKKHVVSPNENIGLRIGSYVHIIINDNGCGMDLETKRRIFEPMFSTKSNFTKKGQGLGMTLVYSVIQKMNGLVYIESQKGQGTSIHLYLPIATRENAEKQAEKQVQRQSSVDKAKMILLIDDDHSIIKTMQRIFELAGYNSLIAEDGKKGIELYKENKDSIGLVILDLTMPLMSGQAVLEVIKNFDQDAKVIIYSGHSKDEIDQEILNKAETFLQKPFQPEEILKIIQKFLG